MLANSVLARAIASVLLFAAVVLAFAAMTPARGQALLIYELQSPNEQENGYFGSAVSGVPDVDGDGKGDLLVGAYFEASAAGRVYVYSGATSAVLQQLQSPNEQENGQFGISVAGVPDADGDGRGDLLVGAGEDNGATGAGRAYLFSGATGMLLHTLSSPNPEQYGGFGFSVSGVPDVNGDGRGDLLVGSFEYAGAGRAYVFSGATGALLQTLSIPETNALSVSGVPDVDSDGRGDLFVGARLAGIGGRAYVFSGASGSLLHEIVSPNEQAQGLFGYAVSSVPDIDGDGRGDLLVGAPQEYHGTSPIFAGRAYAFSGATGSFLQELRSPNEQSSGNFGDAVSGVADVDGDGRGDLLVGAPVEDFSGGMYSDGRAYVFSGATGALLQQLRSSQVSGNFGSAVSGVSDLNGDGRGDFLVGAPAESSPPFSGRAYVFSGKGTGFALNTSGRPANIPPGGTVNAKAIISNANADSAPLDLWIIVMRGFNPVLTRRVGSFTLAGGTTVTRGFDLPTPATARSGLYTVNVNVGTFPTTVLATDTFNFRVTAP